MHEKRVHRIQVSVGDTEKDLSEKAADQRGVTVADWVRHLVRRELSLPVLGDDKWRE